MASIIKSTCSTIKKRIGEKKEKTYEKNGNKKDTSQSEWEKKQYAAVIRMAIKLLIGEPTKNLKALKIKEETWTNFQDTLASCERVWQSLRKTRIQHDEAQKVLKAYYSRDQIFDFMEMLARFLKEEPREDMDPESYAEKGYFNYITYLRSMFGKLQEKYQESPDFQSQEPNGHSAHHASLQNRISLLREVGQSSDELGALADTLEPYISKSPEECPDSNTAEELSNLIGKDRLQNDQEYLKNKTEQMKFQLGCMEKDIIKSRSLYQKLYELLGTEESNELLDKLNPDNGMLKGKTVQEIRECYQPLHRPVQEILESFPKKES